MPAMAVREVKTGGNKRERIGRQGDRGEADIRAILMIDKLRQSKVRVEVT